MNSYGRFSRVEKGEELRVTEGSAGIAALRVRAWKVRASPRLLVAASLSEVLGARALAPRRHHGLAHGMSNAGEAGEALSVGARLRRGSKDLAQASAPAAAGSSSTRSRSGSLGDIAGAASVVSMAQRLRRSSKEFSESAAPAAANLVAMLRPGLKRASTGPLARAPQNAKPASHAVRLRLQRVDFQTISAIDQVAQTFAARIFVIFDIPADAVTDTLLAGLNEEKGPFRSARFHLDCIEFVNLADGGTVTRFLSKMPSGDLNLCALAEGTFNVMYELQTFPYDSQSLSVQIRSKCANEKSAPVELDISTWAGGIQRENFALSNVWQLEETVQVRQKPIQMEASIGLSYPGLRFSVHVQRKSGYYVINVVCPTGLFALLCGCQAWIPRANVADRLSVSLTLLLTATAYKFVTASMLPAVAYQTFLDKYVSMCSAIIILVVLEAPLASGRSHNFDVTAMCVICFLWLIIQIWYVVRVCQFLRENARQMHLMTIAETIRNQQKVKLQQSLTKVAC